MTAQTAVGQRRPAQVPSTQVPGSRPVVLAAVDGPPLRTEMIHFTTAYSTEVWDLTGIVNDVVARSQVQFGQVTVATPHTTTMLLVNEAESGFLNDLRRLLDRTVPSTSYYEHDDHDLRHENLGDDEFVNGHSHCRQVFAGHAAVTIPIVDGRATLGRWQSVMFVELDQARDRRAVIHAQGV